MGLLCGRKEFHIHRLFSDPMDCSAPGFPVLHRLLEFCSNSCPLSQCYPASHALLSPSFPALNLYSIRGFSNESDLHYRRPKYWSFSFSISPSSAYSGLTSFRIDWFDLLAVQSPRLLLKNLLKHHNLKAKIPRHSAFFMVRLSHLYMTTGKTTALTIWSFVGKGCFTMLC